MVQAALRPTSATRTIKPTTHGAKSAIAAAMAIIVYFGGLSLFHISGRLTGWLVGFLLGSVLFRQLAGTDRCRLSRSRVAASAARRTVHEAGERPVADPSHDVRSTVDGDDTPSHSEERWLAAVLTLEEIEADYTSGNITEAQYHSLQCHYREELERLESGLGSEQTGNSRTGRLRSLLRSRHLEAEAVLQLIGVKQHNNDRVLKRDIEEELRRLNMQN